MKLDLSRLVNVKRQSDGSILCQCPICAQHGHDKSGKNHLRVYRSGAFNCILHGKDKDHNRRIRAYLRNTSLGDNPDEEYIDPEPTIKIDTVYPEESLKRLMPVYDYWIGRGAKPEVIRQLEGGLAPSDERSKLSDRFLFPVRGLDGRINGYIGRLVVENSFAPKWKNLVKTSRTVWPWNVTGESIKETKSVILVESPGDLIALLSNDIKNVLCIFGLNLNSKIISTLVANDIKHIIISLNRDDDPNKGQAAAEKIAAKLLTFWAPEAITIKLPPMGVKDWGCATQEQINAFKMEIKK